MQMRLAYIYIDRVTNPLLSRTRVLRIVNSHHRAWGRQDSLILGITSGTWAPSGTSRVVVSYHSWWLIFGQGVWSQWMTLSDGGSSQKPTQGEKRSHLRMISALDLRVEHRTSVWNYQLFHDATWSKRGLWRYGIPDAHHGCTHLQPSSSCILFYKIEKKHFK